MDPQRTNGGLTPTDHCANIQKMSRMNQGKRMKFLKITTILTKLPKLLTGISALD